MITLHLIDREGRHCRACSVAFPTLEVIPHRIFIAFVPAGGWYREAWTNDQSLFHLQTGQHLENPNALVFGKPPDGLLIPCHRARPLDTSDQRDHGDEDDFNPTRIHELLKRPGIAHALKAGFLLFALLIGCAQPKKDDSKQLVPIDASVDAKPWQAIIVCQGDVHCSPADALTICTTRDSACRIVAATPLDGGAPDAPFPSNLAEAPPP